MTLNDIKTNKIVVIKQINLPREQVKRLKDLGIAINCRVSVQRRTLFNSLLAIKVKNSIIALRKQSAKNILVSYE